MEETQEASHTHHIQDSFLMDLIVECKFEHYLQELSVVISVQIKPDSQNTTYA